MSRAVAAGRKLVGACYVIGLAGLKDPPGLGTGALRRGSVMGKW